MPRQLSYEDHAVFMRRSVAHSRLAAKAIKRGDIRGATHHTQEAERWRTHSEQSREQAQRD